MRDIKQLIKTAISQYDDYSEGYGNNGASGNSYILGFCLSTSSVETQFTHLGSKVLDEINAFDIAEANGPYIGQINMSTVSSFCGPQGLILGYDILRNDNLYTSYYGDITYLDKTAKVYSIYPLIQATEKMFGTVDKRIFPLKPGSHVPFANKSIKAFGPSIIFSALAIGIAENRDKDACLLMEDVGQVAGTNVQIFLNSKEDIINKLAKSVLCVGINQRVNFKEIFAGISYQVVKNGEVGCALVAAPYFTLAKNAITKFNLN